MSERPDRDVLFKQALDGLDREAPHSARDFAALAEALHVQCVDASDVTWLARELHAFAESLETEDEEYRNDVHVLAEALAGEDEPPPAEASPAPRNNGAPERPRPNPKRPG